MYVGDAKIKKYLSLIIIVFAMWFGFKQVWGYQQEEVRINGSFFMTLPHKDKQRLQSLFKGIIVSDAAGYTLLGDKPMFYEVFVRPTFKWDLFFLLEAFNPSNLKKQRNWKTWKKYSHLFQKGDFLIWSEPSPWNKHVEFIMIAKRLSFCRVVEENIETFREALNRPFLVAEDLLREIDSKPLFKDILLTNETLFGILLGYGPRNASLFVDRSQGKQVSLQGAFREENRKLFENTRTALNFSFGWPSVELKEALIYPGFLADKESVETKSLKEKYLKNRQDIIDYYEGKDFLTATLQLLGS